MLGLSKKSQARLTSSANNLSPADAPAAARLIAPIPAAGRLIEEWPHRQAPADLAERFAGDLRTSGVGNLARPVPEPLPDLGGAQVRAVAGEYLIGQHRSLVGPATAGGAAPEPAECPEADRPRWPAAGLPQPGRGAVHRTYAARPALTRRIPVAHPRRRCYAPGGCGSLAESQTGQLAAFGGGPVQCVCSLLAARWSLRSLS